MKSKRIRELVFISHRYIGLVIGFLAAVIALTGTLLIIYYWTAPLFEQNVMITPLGKPLGIEEIISKVQSTFPSLVLEGLKMPDRATEPITASLWRAKENEWVTASINPYIGETVGRLGKESAYKRLLYDIHINLLGGEKGAYLSGAVGLLATVLCITGIILWPGWYKFINGFRIKWDAKTKRLNFDLHKVFGIITAVFLLMAMFTGFIWNYRTWTTPIIYAATLSSQPTEGNGHISKPIAGKPPLKFTEELLRKAVAALPEGRLELISFPREPEDMFQVHIREEKSGQDAVASIDRYSGEIFAEKSLGDYVMGSFEPVHFGTFAGIYSRILYFFVGLAPTVLMVTGFIMWRHRRKQTLAKVEPKLT